MLGLSEGAYYGEIKNMVTMQDVTVGFYKSINLGFEPDTPSKSGVITRIVEGVNLYPYTRLSEQINFKQ